MQLREIGKNLGPGQKVRFLLVRTEAGVHAWDLPSRPDPRSIDRAAYRVLFLRAVRTLLQPFGIQPEEVADILNNAATQPPLDLRVHVDTTIPLTMMSSDRRVFSKQTGHRITNTEKMENAHEFSHIYC